MNRLCIFSVLITIIQAVTSEDVNCDKLGVLLYEDLGCQPEFKEPEKCPFKYTCQGLNKWSNECHFRGKTYAIGQNVEDNLSSPSCDKACFCSEHNGKADFTCAILDCPEWLGVRPKAGCSFKHTLNECCASGEICGDNVAKCEVNGKTYSEGETFHPENTCLTCVCQKNFTGKLEAPFCRRTICGKQLKRSSSGDLQNSCAPFYNSDVLCCPRFFICPKGEENIEGESKSEETCKFGEKVLKLGQFVKLENVENPYGNKIGKVRCECSLPPLLTCKEEK